MTTWKRGWRKSHGNGAGATDEFAEVETGYGTPTHCAPLGTIYVKLDATMGTSSHFRRAASTAWICTKDESGG